MFKRKRLTKILITAIVFSLFMSMKPETISAASTISVNLNETSEAFKNPMKGFRPSRYINDSSFKDYEYASIYKHYIAYTNLENTASDSVQKIKDYCNTTWAGIENKNIKVIPRVVIYYPGTGEFWGDIPHGNGVVNDWTSAALKSRLVAMASKLAQAWDNDPRVAAIELGLWGKWGEHNIYPDQIPGGNDRIPSDFQTALGDAFKNAFKNKRIMVRYPETFTNYNFGYIWDSFALPDDQAGGNGIIARNCWQSQMISGEVAYDWGDQSKLGGSPNGTLSSNSNTDYVIGWIQQTHCSSLGWIAEYTPDGGTISANAAKMQKAFGYRYVVNSASFSSRADQGSTMPVTFSVSNKGNAPFYYNWPVKVNLLKADKSVAWSGTFNVDIRNWMPGNSYTINGTFSIPTSIATGTYTLALSVNDPAGDLPSLRFANANYYTGGFTPIGKIGIGQEASDQNLGSFNSLKSDTTLRYSLSGGGNGGGDTQAPTAPSNLTVTGKTDTTVNLSWTASTDNVGVAGYEVFDSNNTLRGSSTSTTCTVTGLTQNTAYTFVAKAKDAAGNYSAGSNSVTVTTNSSSGGTTTYEAEAAGNSLAGGAAVSSSSVCSGGAKVGYIGNGSGTLQFNSVTASTAGSYTMTIYYLTAETRQLSYSINGGAATNISLSSSGGWNTVGSATSTINLNVGNNTIKFFNNSGWAPDIDRITINNSSSGGGDTQAPTTPSNLITTGKTDTSVTLSWTASTDNVKVTGYDVYRGGVYVGSTTSTNYTDTGLTANTAYTYTVKAKDAANNYSSASNSVTVTTNNSTSPSSLVLDNFDGTPSWPGSNDLGKWAGANGFVNGSGGAGVISSGTLVLQYNNNGWFGSDINQSIASFTKMVIRIKGSNGGEQSHFKMRLGNAYKLFSGFTSTPITTSFQDIVIDLTANGVDRTSPGQLNFEFWYGGNSTITIDEIRFQ